MISTQNEVMEKGYQALINSLGVVDTVRFIQYFSSGQGDYTKERHQWLDKQSLEDIFTDIEQNYNDDLSQYDQVIE